MSEVATSATTGVDELVADMDISRDETVNGDMDVSREEVFESLEEETGKYVFMINSSTRQRIFILMSTSQLNMYLNQTNKSTGPLETFFSLANVKMRRTMKVSL